MKIVRLIALLGLISMTGAIGYGLIVGDFASDGAVLLANPWGIVSLVDLYVGFILFSIWIVYRERSIVRSVVWVALVMVLGFWTASLYLLIASLKASSVDMLLLGNNMHDKKSV